jgi:imidazolonepropionase-like amidohydrolase
MQTLFKRCSLIDFDQNVATPDHDVLVEDAEIVEVSDRSLTAGDARVIDVGNRVLLPGLIDVHVHVIAAAVNLRANEQIPNSLIPLHAVPVLRSMLDRGFTSARDAGGADHGLALALESGLIQGPRLFISGRALSQTGGHGDYRGRIPEFDEPCLCCRRAGAVCRVVDGVDDMRRAVRDELRRGAAQIKIMASGGISSPTTPISHTQYSLDELCAAVEEATAANTYVMAHAYTTRAVRRAVECGVRTIEHGNLVDAETAALMRARGAYVVPTLVVFEALAKHGARLGLLPESVAKIEEVRKAALSSLELFKQAGVPMGFGTDLLGELHAYQSNEFRLRSEVQTPIEILRSATLVGAEILNQRGRLGVVSPGAIADLIVVDGNPLTNLMLLDGQGEHLAAIMANGRLHKNTLPT